MTKRRTFMTKRRSLDFAAFCLLSGSGWMIDQFYPEILAGPIHTAAHMGLLALVFAAFSLPRPQPLARRLTFELVLCGVVLLALPTILATGSASEVAGLNLILISAFIPTVVVFLIAQTNTSDDNPMRLLLPALAGLGGAALLIPFYWPHRLAGQLWFVALVVSAILSAVAAIRLHRLLPQTTIFHAITVLCASAAFFSACFYRLGFSALSEFTRAQVLIELLRCLFLEGPVVYLLARLLRDVDPIGISSRYLAVPLVTIVESYLIERPQADWTTYLGAALMAGSCFVLLSESAPGQHGDLPL